MSPKEEVLLRADRLLIAIQDARRDIRLRRWDLEYPCGHADRDNMRPKSVAAESSVAAEVQPGEVSH